MRQSGTPLTRPRWSLTCLVLAATLLALLPGDALAKKVVVLDFEGNGHKLLRDKVVSEVSKKHEVIHHVTVAAEAKKLGFGTDCNETNIMGVASVFSAEGVICGEVSGGGNKRKLKVSINNGGDAQEVASFTVPVGKWGLDAGALKTIRKQVDAALAKTWSWESGGGGEGEAEPEPEPEMEPPPPPAEEGEGDADLNDLLPEDQAADPAPLEEDPEPVPEEEAISVASADDGEDPLAGSRPNIGQKEKVPEAEIKKEGETWYRPEGKHALRLTVGGGARFYRFFDPQGVDLGHPNGKAMDFGYSPGAAGGVSVGLEFFPGAFASKSFVAANLGIGGFLNYMHGPAWQNGPVSGTASNLSAGADLRFRFNLFDNPMFPVVSLKFGIHYMSFAMNDGDGNQAAPFPDMSLMSLDVGLLLDQALWKDRLHLNLFFSYLPVLSVGEVAEANHFGSVSGVQTGLNMGGGFRGNLYGPVGYRLEIAYLRYSINGFEHKAANTFSIWVTKVKDQYVNGTFSLTLSL